MVEDHCAVRAQHLVEVHQRRIQKIPELEGPAPFQCPWSDMSLRNSKTRPSVGSRDEAAQGLGGDRVVGNPLVGVEIEEDQG